MFHGFGADACDPSTSALTYCPRGNLNTLDGPLAGTADTSKYRYDTSDQLIGVTSPDPDGASAMKMRAIRLTYRPDGQVSKQELGTVNSQSDPDWALFAPLQTVDTTFDTNSRVATRKLSASGTNYALTQTGYDALGRLDCSALRMNTAVYGSLPASACTLSTQGTFGPDRIGQTVYDAAGQLIQNKVGVGTADAATTSTLSYSNNIMLATLKDGENNLTTYEYDGFDRLSKTRLPLPTKGANASSTTDYEQLLGYDANSNPGSHRLRDGTSIAFTYDKLDRVTLKNLPGTEPDVSYGYDNLGRITSASQTGNALSFTWDALSRNLTQAGPQGTASYQYDAADRRTQLTYPGTGLFVNNDYLVTGEVTKIRENNAISGVGVLATYAYDNLGNRLSTTFGNGAVQVFTYDPVSRLASLTNNLTGTANDLTATFAYNPDSQITSNVRTGDTYAWTGHGSGSTAYVSNGLNQQTSIGGAGATWDTKGNLTIEPQSAKTYGYSSENLLILATGGVTLGYDPALRLYQTVSGATTTRFAYDGFDAIAEYNAANALQRRFVFDPSGITGQAIVQYEGTGTTNRRFMSADERGSIISLTDTSGVLINLNRYDEYGKPQSTNAGRFQYTGQKWIGEAGLYDYKFRDYLPHLGIFAQTDPIGQAGGPNLYAYVLDDPVNLVDPFGLCNGQLNDAGDVEVCAPCQNGGVKVSSASGGYTCVNRFDVWGRFEFGRDIVDQTRDILADFANDVRLKICAVPSFEVGGEAASYRGLGNRISGAMAFNTATGDVFLKGSFGGGIGIGRVGSIGLSGQASATTAGVKGSLDSRLAAGSGLAGFDVTYNWLTTVSGQNIGSQGVSGSIGGGKAFMSGSAYVAPLEANVSGAKLLGNIGTPCGG